MQMKKAAFLISGRACLIRSYCLYSEPPKQTALHSFGKWKYFSPLKSPKGRSFQLYYSNSTATNRTILQLMARLTLDLMSGFLPSKIIIVQGNAVLRDVWSVKNTRSLSKHKHFICRMCNDLYQHAKCTGNQDLKLIRAGKPHEWTCLQCEFLDQPVPKKLDMGFLFYGHEVLQVECVDSQVQSYPYKHIRDTCVTLRWISTDTFFALHVNACKF